MYFYESRHVHDSCHDVLGVQNLAKKKWSTLNTNKEIKLSNHVVLSIFAQSSKKRFHPFEPSPEWLTLMSTALFWAAHSFEWPTLLSTFLSNKLFWELFLVIYSWEQFFEPSLERWNSFEHFFEHSNECTYSQEHFFEWIYSRECSFGRFLEGSRSTRTLMSPVHSVPRVLFWNIFTVGWSFFFQIGLNWSFAKMFDEMNSPKTWATANV